MCSAKSVCYSALYALLLSKLCLAVLDHNPKLCYFAHVLYIVRECENCSVMNLPPKYPLSLSLIYLIMREKDIVRMFIVYGNVTCILAVYTIIRCVFADKRYSILSFGNWNRNDNDTLSLCTCFRCINTGEPRKYTPSGLRIIHGY